MFEEQNKKTLEILKTFEENVTSIINDKISSINPIQDGWSKKAPPYQFFPCNF